VEPPMAELLPALTRAKAIDFAEAHFLAQRFFGVREEAADNFELIARMLEEMLCYKLLGAELNASSPEASRLMAEFAQAVDAAKLNALLALALEAGAAVGAMSTPRLQGENWWMKASAVLRSE